MKFLIDECVGSSVARWLKEQGYDVVSIYDDFPGISDDIVLKKSLAENRILITADKDFGEMIFKLKHQHVGILLFRLLDQRPIIKIDVLKIILKKHLNDLSGNFVVATEANIRIIRLH